MCGCYLYAITHASTSESLAWAGGNQGVRNQPLYLVTHGELAAVVSTWDAATSGGIVGADTEDVLHHEQVVEAIMVQAPTLPVRFGSILANVDSVHQFLAARQHAFLADLAHVAGRVEMGLRILWEPPLPVAIEAMPAVGTTPGSAYLHNKARQRKQEQAIYAQGEGLVQALNQVLCPLAVDVHLRVLQTERLLLSAAYLVPHNRVVDFRAKIETLRQVYPQLALLASGPWPAYHFMRATGQVES